MSERPMERRVVTALFVDVVGSTALIVQLGSERFKRALDQGFLALRTLIEAEGGSVGTSIGDAIFALFGVPAAHPDDPQRALRAAQACIRWSEASGTTSVPLAVRIGVETGEAIVDLAGAETERQQTSVGACVNLAARLQQLAEPGQILVGPTCHHISAEQAAFAPLGEIELKGLGRQPAWRLVALAGSPGSARPPLVGRDAELERLRLAYRQALSGRTILGVIHGPPGQGKTRLVEEFVTELDDQAKVLKARCRPAGELGARSPLRELLISDEGASSAESLADRLAALFPDGLERHRVFAALAHSVGLIVAQEISALPAGQRQDEIENGWRRYLGALARTHPLVLWVDDLHWADAEVTRLLDRLTLGTDLPLLILTTARPEFATQAGWNPGENRFFVSLDALNDTDALALARHAGRTDPAGVERAEGNPLFIIELTRAQLTTAADLPITLKGIIGARLDELPKQDRELLQRVAVVGETFTVEDAILLSGREPADVQEAFDRLADRLYLRRVLGGLRFHHALVHDVAYGRLTTAERMQLHARFAQAGVPAEDVEARAHHLWEAVGAQDAAWVWEESEAISDLRIRAREAHLAAARRYADRFACERAIEACWRALSFASEAKDVARVERALGEVFAAKGDADQAWSHYLRALDSYKETGFEAPPDLYPSVLELQIYTSGMFVHPPDGALVEALLQEGEVIARRAGDAAALARLLALRAYEVHDAAQLSDALRLTEAVSDPRSLGSLLDHAAILQIRAGEFADAQRSYQRLDTLSAASGLTGERLEFRGILALNIGDLAEAEALAERFRAASASRGPHLQTHAHREQCHVLLAQGNWRGLCELAAETERLVAQHLETNFCYAVTAVLASAVIGHAVEGRRAEARLLLRRAEQMLQAEPEERESVLLLANGVAGQVGRVAELRRQVHTGATPPFWFFTRMEAVVLTMLERWDEVDETLPPLQRVAQKGSGYVEALVAAIREEKAAAFGGPEPTHRMLRELGYRGWSQLLSYRPEVL